MTDNQTKQKNGLPKLYTVEDVQKYVGEHGLTTYKKSNKVGMILLCLMALVAAYKIFHLIRMVVATSGNDFLAFNIWSFENLNVFAPVMLLFGMWVASRKDFTFNPQGLINWVSVIISLGLFYIIKNHYLEVFYNNESTFVVAAVLTVYMVAAFLGGKSIVQVFRYLRNWSAYNEVKSLSHNNFTPEQVALLNFDIFHNGKTAEYVGTTSLYPDDKKKYPNRLTASDINAINAQSARDEQQRKKLEMEEMIQENQRKIEQYANSDGIENVSQSTEDKSDLKSKLAEIKRLKESKEKD